MATYARILDGAHLWLEVHSATKGTLTLVDPDGSAVVEGLSIGADRTTALVIDLMQLTLDDDVAISFLCLGVDGRSHPVRLADVGHQPRARTPATPDGRFRFTVSANETGDLQLTRASVSPAVPVRRVGPVEDGLEVSWRAPSGGTPRMVLRGPIGDVLAEIDTVQDDDDVYGTLRSEELPPGSFSAALWVIDPVDDTASAGKPLRRAHDDLARPSTSVVMPEYRIRADGQVQILRLTWSDDGALGVERTTEDVPRA
ncbi:MAG: hypothetical protein ABWX84_07035 [Nocardioides sp.]